MSEEIQVLKSIEKKLSALLAISIDRYLRENPDVARPRPRSIDEMLVSVGLPVRDVATVLGKSEQAVYQMLQKKSGRKAAATKSGSS